MSNESQITNIKSSSNEPESRVRATDKVAAKQTASPRYSRLTIGATLVAPTGSRLYHRLATGSMYTIIFGDFANDPESRVQLRPVLQQ
jgi:hypothetical protein